MTQPSVRQEFEKAFEEFWNKQTVVSGKRTALWAAKWMAEKIASIHQDWIDCVDSIEHSGCMPSCHEFMQRKIRQLAKELDHDTK